MAGKSKFDTLQALVDGTPDIVDYFYNNQDPPHASVKGSPVPQEFTNWREEQRAWRESVLMVDQTHHMPELFLDGPDALELLSKLYIGTLKNFTEDRAKQFIGCSERGYVIGDCIMHNMGDGRYELISGMPLLDWVQYQAETSGYSVTVERDHDSPTDPKGYRTFARYQLDGPYAKEVFEAIIEGDAPEMGFFRSAKVRVAGFDVKVLRHSMSGHQGVEISTAYENGPKLSEVIQEAGERYGLRRGGQKTYFSTAFESGWIGYPLAPIYDGEDMRGFREWLPGDSWEAKMQLGGSFKSNNIADYYSAPFDLGYGNLIKFDHDFIGRAALEKMVDAPKRARCTLVWNDEDVTTILASLLGDEMPYKYLELPSSNFAFPQRDEVRDASGALIGLSTRCGYTVNERKLLSIGMIAEDQIEFGKEVYITWGEPEGGSRKPRVERHRQMRVRATLAPCPYGKASALKKATLA